MFSCFKQKSLDGKLQGLGVGWITTFANTVIFIGITSAVSLLPVGASAQEAIIEEVVVTGSRIVRANLTQPNPVYALDAEDIKLSGELSVIDLIDDLPQLFLSTNGAESDFFTQDGLDNSPGLAKLDLRGLGSNRTLVLVDGKRHVSGQAGSAAVDVGSIPSAFIERVEVLTGGASSIYGADAVSGVVNFIMKDQYEGTEIDFSGGFADEGAGEELQISFTHGQNFFDDRLNVMFNVTARRREDIMFKDRSWAEDSGIAQIQGQNWRKFFQNADTLPAGATLGSPISMIDGSGNCVAAIAGTNPILVSRACNARSSAIQRNLRFGLTAPSGLFSIALAEDITAAVPERATSFPLFHTAADLPDLAPGTPFMDFDGNGVDDCEQSFVGQSGFWIGGCSVIDRNGSLRPFNPGLVDGDINFDAFGFAYQHRCLHRRRTVRFHYSD